MASKMLNVEMVETNMYNSSAWNLSYQYVLHIPRVVHSIQIFVVCWLRHTRLNSMLLKSIESEYEVMFAYLINIQDSSS